MGLILELSGFSVRAKVYSLVEQLFLNISFWHFW